MMKEQKVGIFVVSNVTHHYHGAPSGTLYTFMKGRGLWITDPQDIEFFRRKVEKSSGFRIEKDATNIADKLKVVKKEEVEEKEEEETAALHITPKKKKKPTEVAK